MARKVPPPSIEPNPDGGRANQPTTPQHYERVPAVPLPPPSPRHSNPSHLGAIPRSPFRSSPTSPDEVRHHRRNMDSLNLDLPRLTPRVREGDGNSGSIFDFSSLYPSLCGSSSMSPEVTAMEGQELYLHFFHEQLRSAGLGDYAVQEEARLSDYHIDATHLDVQDGEANGAFSARRRTYSMNLENFQNPIWRETGRELQSLADAFAHSQERILVRNRAEQVDISSLDMEKFFELLRELFQGTHITRERILVLFFFCSDLAIIAIRNRASGLLGTLTQWSLLFIREQVCSWVHQHGGWSSVLRSGINLLQQAAVIGVCAAVITCCVIYIRKNL